MRQVAKRHLDDVGRDRGRGLARVEGQVGLLAGGNRDDHGLAHRTRDSQDERRSDTGDCGGQDDPEGRLETRRAERERTVPQPLGTARIASSLSDAT